MRFRLILCTAVTAAALAEPVVAQVEITPVVGLRVGTSVIGRFGLEAAALHDWAASLGGGFDYRLSRDLDLIGDLETYIYDDLPGTPRQTDYGVSVGVRFRNPIRL